jgi:hypothetical protein
MSEDQSSIEELELRRVVVGELQATLLRIRTVESFLEAVVERAAQHIAPGAVCTFTVLLQGRFITVASSDERGAVADEAEYEAELGPCVEALRNGAASVVPDLRSDTRWPEWAAASRRLGFLSAAAVPADTGDGAQLALNLYGRGTGSFGEVEMRRSFAYVDEAARVLRLCLMLAQQTDLAEHLSRAMAARATVERAVGILMAQRQISSDDAYAILRAGSQHDGREVHEVAAIVIESVTGHPANGSRRFARPDDPFRPWPVPD